MSLIAELSFDNIIEILAYADARTMVSCSLTCHNLSTLTRAHIWDFTWNQMALVGNAIGNFHFTRYYWDCRSATVRPHARQIRAGLQCPVKLVDKQFPKCKKYRLNTIAMSEDSLKKIITTAEHVTFCSPYPIIDERFPILAKVKSLKFTGMYVERQHLNHLSECESLSFVRCMFASKYDLQLLDKCKRLRLIGCANITPVLVAWLRFQGVDVEFESREK